MVCGLSLCNIEIKPKDWQTISACGSSCVFGYIYGIWPMGWISIIDIRPYFQKLSPCFWQMWVQVINRMGDSGHTCWSVTLSVFLLWACFCYLDVLILYLLKKWSLSISSSRISSLNANTAKPQEHGVVLVEDQDPIHVSCWTQKCVISSEHPCVFVGLWFPLSISSLGKKIAFPTRLWVFQMFAEEEMVDTSCFRSL